MLENGTRSRSYPTTENFPHLVSDRDEFEPSQEFPVPLPPAMPEAVMRLQLMASTDRVDLHMLTEVIRNDIGLTIQLLHMATQESDSSMSENANIAELIVHVGLERLRQLAEVTEVVSFPWESLKARRWQLFAMQARALARFSEELAWKDSPVNASLAFVAGLLRHVGALPFLLGWDLQEWQAMDEGEIGCRLLKAWRLPVILADAVRGGADDHSSADSRSLLSLVEAAEQQTWRPDIGALTRSMFISR